MNKFAILAMAFLLVPTFTANAASARPEKHAAIKYHKRPVGGERKHEPAAAEKPRQDENEAPAAPPVTRLPVSPDTFRA